jgi:hypothetical protein
MENDRMLRNLGIVAMLGSALAMPVHEAAAQDALGGAIIGGGAGALFGGALVGAGTGAAIAAEGERRRNGYYYYRDGCYLQRPDGAWILVHPRYCY